MSQTLFSSPEDLNDDDSHRNIGVFQMISGNILETKVVWFFLDFQPLLLLFLQLNPNLMGKSFSHMGF